MPVIQTPFAIGHVARGRDLPRTRPSAGEHHEKAPSGLAPAEELVEALTPQANVPLSREARFLDFLEIHGGGVRFCQVRRHLPVAPLSATIAPIVYEPYTDRQAIPAALDLAKQTPHKPPTSALKAES